MMYSVNRHKRAKHLFSRVADYRLKFPGIDGQGGRGSFRKTASVPWPAYLAALLLCSLPSFS
jgi:hypothetical protein